MKIERQTLNLNKLELGDVISYKPSQDEDRSEHAVALIFEVFPSELHILRMRPSIEHDTDSINVSTTQLVAGSLSQTYLIDIGITVSIDKNSLIDKLARVCTSKLDEILRGMINIIIEKHFNAVHKTNHPFFAGETYIRYAGRVFDAHEIKTLVDSSLDFWLTAGRYAKQFEADFSNLLGIKHCVLTNSGSSANLLAISALTSPLLGERRLNPGDNVITTACGFPTTVNPIIQNGLVPLFLDVEMGTYNIDVIALEEVISDKTKALFIAHTLGNPVNLDKILKICRTNDLWLIEDNCDALGSKYRKKYTGTFGHISTFSFYPAHHITMGEGGALATNDVLIKRIVTSFRDWGRDCWCEVGEDNTCGMRFSWQLGDLPFGYDHKYIYSHLGYNLKITDMQAAIGVEQLRKLPAFITARKKNFNLLYEGLSQLAEYFILPLSESNAEPCWFGFILTVKDDAGFSRNEIVKYLEQKKIATRMLFAGNITRQPSFNNVKYIVHDNLETTDFIMNNSFWIGVFPGITAKMIDYIIDTICKFIEKKV